MFCAVACSSRAILQSSRTSRRRWQPTPTAAWGGCTARRYLREVRELVARREVRWDYGGQGGVVRVSERGNVSARALLWWGFWELKAKQGG